MPIIRILLLLMSFYHVQTFACDKTIECPKCGEKSEFTWNPSNQDVTTRLNRFYEMEGLIDSAYLKNDYARAKSLIKENLGLAAAYSCNWNYGNAIHHSNRVLGLIALKNNDVSGAASYLLEAGKSTGSPQLNSFGPNLDLANELLSLGEGEAVISYLLSIQEFWDGKESTIDGWIQKIGAGEEIQLNQYQPGKIEIVSYVLSLAWPLILALVFWVKIRANLSNNWTFPLTAILVGFISMFLGGLLLGPIIMALLNISHEGLMVPLIIGMSVITQVGVPLLAVFLVASFFKNRTVAERG